MVVGSMRLECGHDRRLGLAALHPYVDQAHLEAEAAGAQLVQEVVGRRAAPAGDHGDPQRRADQRSPAVGGQQPFLGQRFHDAVPLGASRPSV